MPADLNQPFGESCCDGGECSTGKKSAQPCGCDEGISYLCARHKAEKQRRCQHEWVGVTRGYYCKLCDAVDI